MYGMGRMIKDLNIDILSFKKVIYEIEFVLNEN